MVSKGAQPGISGTLSPQRRQVELADDVQRQEQVTGIIGQRDEAVLQVEGACRSVDGIDLNGAEAGLIGDVLPKKQIPPRYFAVASTTSGPSESLSISARRSLLARLRR